MWKHFATNSKFLQYVLLLHSLSSLFLFQLFLWVCFLYTICPAICPPFLLSWFQQNYKVTSHVTLLTFLYFYANSSCLRASSHCQVWKHHRPRSLASAPIARATAWPQAWHTRESQLPDQCCAQLVCEKGQLSV